MANIDATKLTADDWPTAEDETWEFKSSNDNRIAEKIPKYASGFANGEGGCLVWGINDHGEADGGVPTLRGKQPVCDWIDKILAKVRPAPMYSIATLTDTGGRGTIRENNQIIAICVNASNHGPHQSEDNKYYVRLGAHTNPASHAIVEALWARRQVQTPIVECVTRSSRNDYCLDHIALVNLSASTAYHVSIEASVTWDEPCAEAGLFSGNAKCGVLNESSSLAIHTPVEVEFQNDRAWRKDNSAMQSNIEHPRVHATWKWHDLSGSRYTSECDAPFASLSMSTPDLTSSIRSIASRVSDLKRGLTVRLSRSGLRRRRNG